MSIAIKVPSIACEGCAETITKAIQSQVSDAKITVDVSTKIVTVDSKISDSKIREIIIDTGHTPE
jgi:copper chaperone